MMLTVTDDFRAEYQGVVKLEELIGELPHCVLRTQLTVLLEAWDADHDDDERLHALIDETEMELAMANVAIEHYRGEA